jgi:hypothetical protein
LRCGIRGGCHAGRVVHHLRREPEGAARGDGGARPCGISRGRLRRAHGPRHALGSARRRRRDLGKFARDLGSKTAPGVKTRILTNLTASGAIEPVDFAPLKEIAEGVPRSFPFRGISLHFSADGFSKAAPLPTVPDPRTLGMLISAGVDVRTGSPITGGVTVQDSWWVK